MSRVRANTIMDQSGSGAPDFPYGFTANSGTVTGLLTATTYEIEDLYVGSAATITATTVSTSSTTGALQVSGGVGIAKSVYIGEDLDVTGSLSVGGTITYDDIHNLDSIGIVTARTGIHIESNGLTIVGVTTGLSVSGVGTFGAITATTITGSGALTVTDTTQSTSKDTGAIILNGGIGCEKNLNVGTAVTMDGSTGLTTFSQGIRVGGGNPLFEKAHVNTTAWSASVAAGDINLDYGMVHLNTAVLAGTGNTLNITSATGINTQMAVGDVISVTGITSVSATTAFVNTLKIDHSTVQVAWSGGSVPSAGSSTGYDVYAFNIIKTASAKYAVIGNQIKAG
jgi:hypothetical protein